MATVSDARPSEPTLPMPGPPPAAGQAETTLGSEIPVLAGYRCERLLGRGGMGEVWLAQHLTLQRSVALKVVRSELGKDPAFAERFLREARVAAALTHPGVVSVHDAGQVAGHLYLAMDYMPGGDLHQRMITRSLTVDQAIDLIIRVADGLQAIHDAGLVHRDLKPDNILLDAKGHPRIADLGLARTQVGDDRMTATGMAMGTPSYMSPEQANGSPDLDGRSDIYSLAATLFALLAGRPPFSGPTPYVTVSQVLNDPAPDLHAINPHVSVAVAAVVAQALAKQPGKRPATARAFATALEQARSGGAALPAPRQRRGLWLIVGVLSTVVIIGVLIAVMTEGDKASASPATPSSPKPEASTTTATATTSATPRQAFRNALRSVRGTVLGTFKASLPSVHRASVAALTAQKLTLVENRGDSTSARIEAKFGDDEDLTIILSPLAGGATQAAVQVGAFGDEARAKVVLAWIQDEL